MVRISNEQYQYAQARVEELLPLVDGYDLTSRDAIELSVLSDVVIEYEKEHFPIEKPTIHELIEAGLAEKSMTQKELASAIGVSPSRISEFVSGKAEPSLRQASLLCKVLDIKPALMLGM